MLHALLEHNPRSLRKGENLLRPNPRRMDLLYVYDFSSDEEPPLTTTATPPLKVDSSKEKVWSNNFQKIKEFYEENKHLNLPRKEDPEYARLYTWLSYQRGRSEESLRKQDQLERLKSIQYKASRFHRDKDKKGWQVIYDQVKQIHAETGDIKFTVKDHALSNWVSRQKRLLRDNSVDPTRQEMLMGLGICASTTRCYAKKKVLSKKCKEQWQSQYQKLKEHHRIKGNCNVPQHWEKDRSLGIWVCNQRKQYKQLKTGQTTMDPDRRQKLEQLGFGSSVNDKN
jgi:hypothetical protein